MNSKKVTIALLGMYLLPWGIQYLINNFMSVYVAALPFATDKTVGEVLGIAALVTCLSQTVWPYVAGKAKNKSNVLFLSLILMAATSLLFLKPTMTKMFLYISVILFNACFMAHQPLIDTICSEIHYKTKFSFGFFRSFASLGYGIAGFVLVALPHDNPALFFVYTAVLALVSAIFSKMVKSPRVFNGEEDKGKNIFNSAYIKFLIYTLILYIGNSGMSAFFAVYFTSPEGLGGSLGFLSLIMGISAFAEWLIVMFYSKFAEKIKAKYTFFMIAFLGVFRSIVIYLAPTPGIAVITMVFNCMWFGLLWATVTPYIKKIVPAEGNAFAQGLWTVVSSGAGTFIGSYASGIYAEAFGQKSLFLAVAILMGVLALLTPVLIEEKKG